jgi:hypothetical protein
VLPSEPFFSTIVMIWGDASSHQAIQTYEYVMSAGTFNHEMLSSKDPLGRMTFVLPGRVSNKKRMLLGVLSKDSRGIAARVADLCVRYGVKIVCCFGSRVAVAQSSYFEVIASDERALSQLQTELNQDDMTLKNLEQLAVDRVVELKVRVFDQTERPVALEMLLRDLFTQMAESKGNMTRFEAKGVESGLPVNLLVEGNADVELPKGVDVEQLHRRLFDLCPVGSELALRELPPRGKLYRLVLKK